MKVRKHLLRTVDGYGRVSKGDYVTTWHNGVPAGQEDVQLDVTVSPL